MDVVTLGAALSIMKKMPDTAASSAAAAEDAADRAEEAARTLTIDDTLSESGQAADAKAVGDALAKKLDITTVPNIADNANQLLSEKYVVDTEPYHFRPSGGNGADREFDAIVGGSVVWNQLVSESAASVTVTSGHKYISKIDGTYTVAVSDGTAVTVAGGTDEIFDLTAMLGSEIADYIYSLEQATAGAGVAWFRKYFPNNYYDYNPGELLSVSDLQSHDTVGFNLFDEEWEVGDISATTGQNTESSTVIRAKNYIPVIPGATYFAYIGGQTDFSLRTRFYDANKNYLGITQKNGNAVTYNNAFTVPDNACYMRFSPQASYGTTYNHDVCLNLSWDGERDGEYEPYVKRSYPLDPSLTLRGIPKLTADGDLTYDGDIYKPDGTVERRYGIVDLGTLTWSYITESEFANGGFFQSNAITSMLTATLNIESSKYPSAGVLSKSGIISKFGSSADKIIYTANSSARVFVLDSAYTDAESFKSAMSGVMLVYELAEPTTEEADPYTSLQILDPYGTEEYVTTSLVPVGHETKYPENLRAKIEGLPWNFASLIAPMEAEFKATRNYTSGSLFIVNNTLYKATANIANGGTITPNTNCTATTLAEIIAAL